MALYSSKKLSALLGGITSKHDVAFYCLNCLHSFRTKDKLELHKKNVELNFFFNIVMPFEDTKILEFNQYHKSDKTLFSIYGDLESLIEKIEKIIKKKKNEHIV